MDDHIKLDPVAARYIGPITRVLTTYPPGHPGLVAALVQVCHTAHTHGHTAGVSATAEGVCEGLHAGPPTGVKCRSCYEAEQGFYAEQAVRGEIQASWARGDVAAPATLPEGEIIEEGEDE